MDVKKSMQFRNVVVNVKESVQNIQYSWGLFVIVIA